MRERIGLRVAETQIKWIAYPVLLVFVEESCKNQQNYTPFYLAFKGIFQFFPLFCIHLGTMARLNTKLVNIERWCIWLCESFSDTDYLGIAFMHSAWGKFFAHIFGHKIRNTTIRHTQYEMRDTKYKSRVTGHGMRIRGREKRRFRMRALQHLDMYQCPAVWIYRPLRRRYDAFLQIWHGCR